MVDSGEPNAMESMEIQPNKLAVNVKMYKKCTG